MTDFIPRLDFDQLESRLAEALRPRVERLGYLGEFFRCAAHQPDALRAFVEFTETAKEGLPKKLVETVALTCATRLGNEYERHQHERLSVRLGFGKDWIRSVEALAPEGAGLAEDERVVQSYVLAALAQYGKDVGEHLEAMVRLLGHARAVAVMMVMGRYVVHALIVNSLDLKPPVPSIFEDGFEG